MVSKRPLLGASLGVGLLLVAAILLMQEAEHPDPRVRELVLEDLGRPTLPRMVRRTNEIHGYGGKLYLGYGDWLENTGPTSIVAFDPKLGTFHTEFSSPEQAIVRYRELDGRLVIPGIDAVGRRGNVLVREDDGWEVRWTKAGGPSHIFDIASLDGEWFAGVDGRVLSSRDQGRSWRTVRNLREDLPQRARVVCLAAYRNKLYAFPLFTVRGRVRALTDARGPREADVWDGETWTRQDILPEGYERCVAATVFAGDLVTYSYHASPPSPRRFGVLQRFDGTRSKILASPFHGTVKDLEALGGQLLVLGKVDDSWKLGVTRDLTSWDLWSVPGHVTPLSVWVHDERIYLGGDDGHLYRQIRSDSAWTSQHPLPARAWPRKRKSLS